MLLRGISSLIGGFPEDFSSFTGSTLGLMSTFYYLMAWILLFVFGFQFQKYKGFDSKNMDDEEDKGSLEGDADDQFKKQVDVIKAGYVNPTLQ